MTSTDSLSEAEQAALPLNPAWSGDRQRPKVAGGRKEEEEPQPQPFAAAPSWVATNLPS
jgi:hypothetical protein